MVMTGACSGALVGRGSCMGWSPFSCRRGQVASARARRIQFQRLQPGQRFSTVAVRRPASGPGMSRITPTIVAQVGQVAEPRCIENLFRARAAFAFLESCFPHGEYSADAGYARPGVHHFSALSTARLLYPTEPAAAS